MRNYTPRKKKVVMPVIERRTVRIDHRTVVEVPAHLTDEEAIERYYNKHITAVRPPVDDLEDVLDDSDLPEEE